MHKKPLIGASICAVVLLVLASLSNVVGYQTVQSLTQKIIEEKINQKKLLYQTILDIVNNKEIQGTKLKHQISRGEFSGTAIPVFTMKQLKQMYLVGLMLSKIISKSRIQSMIQVYQINNPLMQKGISNVIERNNILKEKISRSSSSECDCENRNTTNQNYTGLCIFLFPLFVVLWLFAFAVDLVFEILRLDMNNRLIFLLYIIILFPYAILYEIGTDLNCFWGWKPYPSTTR